MIITLALGIGITSSIFWYARCADLQALPCAACERRGYVVSTTHDTSFEPFSYRGYLDIRGKTKSYDAVTAEKDMEAVGFRAEPGTTPRVKGGMMVSGNYFQVLGVQPRLGRAFREDEDQVPGRDAVVVLGPDFWKHEFASDPSALGRTIHLHGADFKVIGIAPETFPGAGNVRPS